MLFAAFPALAAHLKGGYIEYRDMGPTPGDPSRKRYEITVYQYLLCASTTAQIDNPIYLGIFGQNFSTTLAVSRSGGSIIDKRQFLCIDNPPQVCYRIDQYVTSVDLPVSSLGGYTFAVQRCCRIPGIINVANSGSTGITYTVRIPTDDNAQLFTNSSPVFAQEDTAIVCANNRFNFPFKATDPADRDSLVYRFVSGIHGGSMASPVVTNPPPPPYTPVSYNTPFSATSPMGNTVTIDPRTGIVTGIAPAQAGDYVVAVAVDEYRNGSKIAESRKELHITVANCNIPDADLPVRITSCDGFTVQFENLSTAANITSYYWDFGVANNTLDTSTLPRPSYTYADTGVYIAKLIVNKEGPCTDSTTTEVRVFPGFFPGFGAVGSCANVPFQFNDSTRFNYGTVDKWRWDFGNPGVINDTAIVKNPQYTYPAPGTYTVTLIAGSSKGCEDTATLTVNVLDKPVLTVAFKDTLICSIDSLQLHAFGTGTFSWAPASRIINSNTADPIVFPNTTTTYTVTLNDRGCTATENVKVNVLDFITVDAGRDTVICLTDSLQLRAVSQGLGYAWTPPESLNNAAIKNPVAKPTVANITYYVTANLGKCLARDSVHVKTVPYPRADAGPDTTVCFATTATLTGNVVGSTFAWTPTRFVRNPASLTTVVTPVTTTTFVLSVYDTLGCPRPFRDSVIVTVRPRITIFAGNDTIIVINQPLQLNAISNATIFAWTPTTGMNDGNISNPVVTLRPGSPDEIIYIVKGSTAEGCNASDTIKVKIFKTPPSIFVPNAFTPNGDQLNDVFKPILAGMQRMDFFRIFNRYGQLVFETKQIGRGWDGKIKGQPQDSNTFVYMVQALDYNGQVVKQSGSFSLIR